MLWNEIP